MKKYALVIILLGLVNTISIDTLQESNKKFNELRSQGGVSQFLVDLAQLNTELVGPLSDLKEGITKLGEEMQEKLQILDNDYEKKQNQFLGNQRKLQEDLDQASIDIGQSSDNLDNNLLPGKDSLEKRLKEIESFLVDNRNMLDREALSRTKAHDNYIEKMHEHDAGIKGVDEALQLTLGLQRGSVSFSEVQMRNTIEYIQMRLGGHEEYISLLSALLDLSDVMADQESVKKLRELLSQLRKDIVDGLNDATSQEKEDNDRWEQRQTQLQVEYHEFQRQINEGVYQQTTYLNRIQQEQTYIVARKDDLQQYQTELEMENSGFAENTSLYQELRTQTLQEIDSVERAISSFINSSQFKDLMQSKDNKSPIQMTLGSYLTENDQSLALQAKQLFGLGLTDLIKIRKTRQLQEQKQSELKTKFNRITEQEKNITKLICKLLLKQDNIQTARERIQREREIKEFRKEDAQIQLHQKALQVQEIREQSIQNIKQKQKYLLSQRQSSCVVLKDQKQLLKGSFLKLIGSQQDHQQQIAQQIKNQKQFHAGYIERHQNQKKERCLKIKEIMTNDEYQRVAKFNHQLNLLKEEEQTLNQNILRNSNIHQKTIQELTTISKQSPKEIFNKSPFVSLTSRSSSSTTPILFRANFAKKKSPTIV